MLSPFCVWIPFILGAIKPLKKVSIPLLRNDAFLRAKMVVFLPGSLS